MDKNRLTLRGEVRQDELYDLMLALAERRLGAERVARRARHRVMRPRFGADHQVGALTDWLQPRISPVSRKERQVTYRELPAILKPHGYALGGRLSNAVEVIRETPRRRGIVRREEVIERKVIGRIGFRNEGETVSRKTMKQLRTMCRLREEDGVDSEALFGGADVVDGFVNRYRTVLRRLAKT